MSKQWGPWSDAAIRSGAALFAFATYTKRMLGLYGLKRTAYHIQPDNHMLIYTEYFKGKLPYINVFKF